MNRPMKTGPAYWLKTNGTISRVTITRADEYGEEFTDETGNRKVNRRADYGGRYALFPTFDEAKAVLVEGLQASVTTAAERLGTATGKLAVAMDLTEDDL